MERVLGMVLAGGRGSRMDVLSQLRPKPALPFAGRLRVIDFSLSNCVHSQVTTAAVLVDYQRSYMGDYLRGWTEANAGSAKISVLQPESGSYAGTADAVYRNLAYLNGQPGDRVLVLAGDHVYRMDYSKMLAFHEKARADATIGVVQVPLKEADRFGTVATNGEGRIQRFVEKSSRPLSSLASMGIYIFNKDILSRRLMEDANARESLHDFGYAVLPAMVKRDRVFAYEFQGYWQDIGTVEAYYRANMELLSVRPRFSFDSRWPVLSDNHALCQREGSGDGNVVNSLISPGCTIKGRVENSILSPGVHVEAQATVRNSIVMANTCVGYHSYVDSSILDEGVEIGRFCYVGLGSGLLPGNQGITVVGKQATVPPCTAVGCGCRVLPKVGPNDFAANLLLSKGTIMAGAK